MGLPLRCCSGQGPHLAKTLEPRVFLELRRDSQVTMGLPPLLALGSPVFHSIGEGKLGVSLESLQGQLYSETLENEEHTKGKQRKEVVQIRTESNETKARKTTESMLMSV